MSRLSLPAVAMRLLLVIGFLAMAGFVSTAEADSLIGVSKYRTASCPSSHPIVCSDGCCPSAYPYCGPTGDPNCYDSPQGGGDTGGTCPGTHPVDCGSFCCSSSYPYCGTDGNCYSSSGGGGGGGGGSTSCDYGYKDCGDGSCAPTTATCCASAGYPGYHCKNGATCNSDGTCGSGGSSSSSSSSSSSDSSSSDEDYEDDYEDEDEFDPLDCSQGQPPVEALLLIAAGIALRRRLTVRG